MFASVSKVHWISDERFICRVTANEINHRENEAKVFGAISHKGKRVKSEVVRQLKYPKRTISPEILEQIPSFLEQFIPDSSTGSNVVMNLSAFSRFWIALENVLVVTRGGARIFSRGGKGGQRGFRGEPV